MTRARRIPIIDPGGRITGGKKRVRQKITTVLVVNVLFLIAIFSVAELTFGDWFSAHKIGMLHVRANANEWFDVSSMYPRREPAHYTRDRWGLRGDFKSPAEIDVLALGGSTTDQTYIDDSYTWAHILEQDFAANGRHLIVANAGIDGASTVGHLMAMTEWLPVIPDLRPSYVLFFVGINDAFRGGLGPAGGPRDTMRSPDWLRRIGDLVRNNSAIYRLYATATGYLAAGRARLRHGHVDSTSVEWHPFTPPTVAEALALVRADILDGYRDRLRRLAKLTVALGARPIFVTQQQASYRRGGDRWYLASSGDFPEERGLLDYGTLLAFNTATMQTCREIKGICVDLGAEIEMQPGDYYDYVHTTQQGSVRIGHFLHDKLANELPDHAAQSVQKR